MTNAEYNDFLRDLKETIKQNESLNYIHALHAKVIWSEGFSATV